MDIQILKDRGRQLFEKKISEASEEVDIRVQGRLSQLKELFADKVAVMAIEDLFAAGRMAQSCISAAKDINSPIEENYVINCYKEIKSIPLITSPNNTENENLTKQLQNEIKMHDVYLEKESIDLIYDVDLNGLSAEGKRIRGYLPANFDSEIDDEENFALEDLIQEPTAKMIYSSNGDGEIKLLCPKCESDCLVLETESGCCLDCDCTFKTGLTLGDMLIEGQEAPKSSKHFDGGIIRISGEKKNRGESIVGEE